MVNLKRPLFLILHARLAPFLAVFEKVDDFWEPAKKQLLADAKGFMDSLVKFDKDNIPDRIIKKVSYGAQYLGIILR